MTEARLISPAFAAVALAGYFALLIGIGVWTRRRSRSFRDYVTGGGAIPGWMLMLSFVANFISTNTFLAHSAQSYKAGLVWLLVGATIVACCAASWWLLAPPLARFAAERRAETLPDFFALRFGSSGLAAIVNSIVVVATVAYVLSVMRSAGTMLQVALDVPYVEALVVLYAVTVAYCLFGGLWADVTTDTVQAVLLSAGAFAVFVAVFAARGGAPIDAPPIQAPPLGLVMAVGLGGGLKMMADPKQLLVFYALKDESVARRFRYWAPLVLLAIFAFLFPVGYLARGVVRHTGEVEQLVPRLVFVEGVAPPFVAVLVLGGMLAAAMSSLDSALLVVASCLEKHVVSRLSGTEPSATRARWLLFGVATFALLLSFRPLGGIITLTTFAGALLGASLLPGMVAGLARLAVPAWAVSASVVAGALGAAAGIGGRSLLREPSPWLQDTFVGLACAVVPLLPWVVAQRRRRGPGHAPELAGP